MDKVSEFLVNYAKSLTFEELPADVVHQAKRVWIDTLGCAIGGFTGPPCEIARELALGVSTNQPATILGTGQPTTPELVAFCNGVAIRYVDYNDTYTGKELGHPIDNIAAILAAGELAHASGKGVLTATGGGGGVGRLRRNWRHCRSGAPACRLKRSVGVSG